MGNFQHEYTFRISLPSIPHSEMIFLMLIQPPCISYVGWYPGTGVDRGTDVNKLARKLIPSEAQAQWPSDLIEPVKSFIILHVNVYIFVSEILYGPQYWTTLRSPNED
jgi:hypothetical protein